MVSQPVLASNVRIYQNLHSLYMTVYVKKVIFEKEDMSPQFIFSLMYYLTNFHWAGRRYIHNFYA